MVITNKNIQIILAQSILGLRPTGVEMLGDALLEHGLSKQLNTRLPIVKLPTLNHAYSTVRDSLTSCLNAESIKIFSSRISDAVSRTVRANHFPLVLGGDCSILIGAMLGLKSVGNHGLIFLDAHADFYEPERSTTGEVADMDLAIVTGRGPALLTDIGQQQPYVRDEQVIHVGQRDWEETQHYQAQDIRKTKIKCYPAEEIKRNSIEKTFEHLAAHTRQLKVDGFWIHFDTDVLSDEINPAVDYRLTGGLSMEDVGFLLHNLIKTGTIAGMSVSIYNPSLDKDGCIGKSITESLGGVFQ